MLAWMQIRQMYYHYFVSSHRSYGSHKTNQIKSKSSQKVLLNKYHSKFYQVDVQWFIRWIFASMKLTDPTPAKEKVLLPLNAFLVI